MRYVGQLAATALLALAAGATASWSQTDTDDTGAYAQRLRELLRVQGYSQIDFQDLKGKTVTAKACSSGDAFRVSLNREGRVLERNRTGACDPAATGDPVSADVIIDTLYGQGYLRLDIVDRTLPTLLINACRGERKFQIRMDDDGDIIDAKPDGTCDLSEGDPLEPAQIERILGLQGYRNVRMPTVEAETYTVTACSGIREFQLTVSDAAFVSMRRAVGFCDPKGKNVEYIPPRPVESGLLTTTDTIEPESCQIIADWLQYQKPLTFAETSAQLSDDDMELITQVANALKRCGPAQVLIEGHTSKTGSDEMNQTLSEKRAIAVLAAFADRGIAKERLTARGFGEAYPRFITDGENTGNRRIEINLEWDLSQS